jgi:hypothetical protein
MRRWLARASLMVLSVQMACGATAPSGRTDRCRAAHMAAQDLLDSSAGCRAGEGCLLVSDPSLGIPCAVLFHCPFAVSEATDLAAFAARVRQLRAEAQVCQEAAVPCVTPLCVPAESLAVRCDGAAGRCTLVSR